jgi:hypothetical protein
MGQIMLWITIYAIGMFLIILVMTGKVWGV